MPHALHHGFAMPHWMSSILLDGTQHDTALQLSDASFAGPASLAYCKSCRSRSLSLSPSAPRQAAAACRRSAGHRVVAVQQRARGDVLQAGVCRSGAWRAASNQH